MEISKFKHNTYGGLCRPVSGTKQAIVITAAVAESIPLIVTSNSWDKMSEDQKKQTFDSLPQEKKQGKSYLEWVKEGYHNQYENWMPWIEDQYLKWFTNDNKARYAAKGQSVTCVYEQTIPLVLLDIKPTMDAH